MLGYRILGTGTGPWLVCCNGIGCSMDTFWNHLVAHFSSMLGIILWDYRGHHRSGLPADPEAMGIDNIMGDLEAILEAEKIDTTLLIGHSWGVQVCLEFAHRFPERTLGLITGFGTYENPFKTFLNSAFFERQFDRLLQLFELTSPTPEHVARKLLRSAVQYGFGFPVAKVLGFVNWQLSERKAIDHYMTMLAEMDLRTFITMAKHMRTHSLADELGNLRVPTLIIAGEDDVFTPLAQSLLMHERIPGSELLVLRRGSHAAYVEYPELINLRIEKFLEERILPSWQRRSGEQVRQAESS